MTSLSAPLRVGPLSWLVPVRAAAVTLVGLALLGVLVVLDISMGDFEIPLGDVVATLLGGGDAGQQFIVRELRLPQTLVAVLVGAALGLSGALTQTFARNPLASPDILGVTEGAAFGAVAVIVLSGTTGYGAGLVTGTLQHLGLPVAAFLGGLLTAAVLYVFSWRRGIDGQRLVLVGIGLGAALSAGTSWLLVRARIEDAASAQVWLNGSLNGRGWDQAWPMIWTLVVLVPVSLLLVRALNTMMLGDDSARGLGVRLQVTQLLTLVAAVGLAAVAVSAVGPLEFVAFVVPQIALRLTGGSRPPMLASMVLGGCLVVGADLLTRVVIPFAIPAGIVTAAIGAPYLIWLLLRGNRKVSA
ncbi:iron chelate uptake ABC transporter family permease subunit [Nocardioides sp. W7]|uniref:FecCD family ABC transporter permease n=1 Tax=Nocardioides sp. W7 TaxID=2931390 RepID=UPI001FD21091|nr:iron chelate uptake ABC transporter family permease subunit [Nocardioides sp. W7]